MLDCIVNNPYRTLGVLSNSPLKERVANINRLNAFAKVGKEVNFPNDFAKILPSSPNRSEKKIAEASNAVNLDKDKLKHALFWFIKGNPVDEIALKHLQSGNPGKAREIFLKKETCSSLINAGVLSLAEDDINAGFESISKVVHSPELLKDLLRILDLANLSIAEDELALMFIEELLKEVPAKSLMRAAKRDADKTILGKLALEKPIAAINSAIEIAKNVDSKDSEKNLAAGTELMESTKPLLKEVKDIAGASSPQYQVVADNLAKQILQCGINYYNNAPESDVESPRKAMKLQYYALLIAVGEVARQRCQENYDILKEAVDSMPPKEVAVEVSKIREELKKFCELPDKITHSIALLNNTKPLLLEIKRKLGSTNSFYLHLSTQVVGNALHNVIEVVNQAQNHLMRIVKLSEKHGVDIGLLNSIDGINSPKRILDTEVKPVVREAWKATVIMDSFDIEDDFRKNRYNPNRQSLKELCNSLGLSTTVPNTSDSINTNNQTSNIKPPSTPDVSGKKWYENGCLVALLVWIILGVIIGSIIAAAFDGDFAVGFFWSGLIALILNNDH